MRLRESVRSGVLRLVGYVIPLLQSLPPLGVWTGLMTLPFATYLVLLLTNLPARLPAALSEFFTPFLIVEKTLLILGLFILVYSIIHLELRRRDELVTSGPYRFVRHPQYFGILLSTMGLTSWSVWILHHTFGTGWLSPSQTIVVWFLELFAYVILAQVEELFLSRRHGKAFKTYTHQVAFFLPFVNTKRRWLDALLTLVVLSLLLLLILNIQML